MKTLVTCDQVFEKLTGGPFPTGREIDQSIQEHVRVCHDCRKLAEALRPAVDLMHEAMSAADRVALPCYQPAMDDRNEQGNGLDGRIAMVMDRVRGAAEDSNHALSNGSLSNALHPAEVQLRPSKMNSLFSMASLAAALAVVLCIAVIGPWRGSTGSASAAATAAEKRDFLTELGVSEDCLKVTLLEKNIGRVNGQVGAVDSELANCCTNCHHAGESGLALKQEQTVVLANSCLVCHVAPNTGE